MLVSHLLTSAAAGLGTSIAARPNILLLFADDWGRGDQG